MKKKLFVILLALVMIVSMVACEDNGVQDNDDEISESSKDHEHKFKNTENSDHNYHEVKCRCGEKKTEVHSFEQSICSVCERENHFSYNTTQGEGICVIKGIIDCYPVIVIPSVIDGCRVTRIGQHAFNEKVNRFVDGIVEVVLPDTLVKIDSCAFANCDELTKINIPDGVTEIGQEAFTGCKSLNEINIPDSVTYIGDWVFDECDSLTTINYAGTKEQWSKIEFNHVLSFYENGAPKIICSDGEYIYE